MDRLRGGAECLQIRDPICRGLLDIIMDLGFVTVANRFERQRARPRRERDQPAALEPCGFRTPYDTLDRQPLDTTGPSRTGSLTLPDANRPRRRRENFCRPSVRQPILDQSFLHTDRRVIVDRKKWLALNR